MAGRQDDNCLGAQYAIVPRSSTEPGIVRYACSVGIYKYKLWNILF